MIDFVMTAAENYSEAHLMHEHDMRKHEKSHVGMTRATTAALEQGGYTRQTQRKEQNFPMQQKPGSLVLNTMTDCATTESMQLKHLTASCGTATISWPTKHQNLPSVFVSDPELASQQAA